MSKNSGSSYGGGVTFGFGSQNGVSFQGNIGSSRGNSTGSEVHYDNTLVTATDTLKIKSGGDTNLIGAQVAGGHVQADIGGNLNIQSLQDRTDYQSKQSNSGLDISVCVPPICYGEVVSGTVSAARQKVDHHYQSATGQSGIAAGDGGFDLNVKGNTDLKGGAITSTAGPDKNNLTTASLTTSDLDNRQDTHSSSRNLSLSYSSGSYTDALGNVQQGTSMLSNAARSATNTTLANLTGGSGGLPGNNHETSQTLSVISASNVKITGTGNQEVDAQSSANAQALTSRDSQTANGALINTLTLQQAQEIPKAQQQAQERQRAAQLVGSVIDNVIGDVSQRAGWKEGSVEKTVLHGLAGLVQAKVGDGSALAGVATGALNEQMLPVIEGYLNSQGINRYNSDGSPNAEFSELLKAGSTLVGAAVGAAIGGSSGAATGAVVANNATTYNRLLHENEKAKIKQLANGDPVLEEQLTQAACYLVHCAAGKADGDSTKTALLATSQEVALNLDGKYTQALALLDASKTADLFTYSEADKRLDALNAADPRHGGGLTQVEQKTKDRNLADCREQQGCVQEVNSRYDKIVSDRVETTLTTLNVLKAYDQCGDNRTCVGQSLAQMQALQADMKARGLTLENTDRLGLNAHIAQAQGRLGGIDALIDGALGAALVGAMANEAGNAGKTKGIKGGAAAEGIEASAAKISDTPLANIAENIHPGQQGKHVPGDNNFIPGRSYLNEGVDPQKLLDGARAGEFPVVGTGSRGQPIVDFGRNIGVDSASGLPTRYGTIHSGNNGAHIVPTNPTTIGGR